MTRSAPLYTSLLVLFALAAPAQSEAPTSTKPSPGNAQARPIDWVELLPPDERDAFDAPSAIHDYLGEGGPAAAQLGSVKVNSKLDRTRVKIPGFMVPLELLAGGVVRELFLVPYFGACIHVPPPPPNQIVYVKMAEPVEVDSIYEAVWITGTLRTETKNSRFGSAAYTLHADKVEPYTY